jgi:hypothetical protein
MMEFSDGVSLSLFPQAQSMFYPLAVNSSTNGLAVVDVFLYSFKTFPHVLE